MSIKRYYNLIQALDFYLRRKSTGDPNQFAKKLNKSKRTILRILSDLKNLGVPIGYSKLRNSYYYKEDGHMVRELFAYPQALPYNEQKEISQNTLLKLQKICSEHEVTPYDALLKDLCSDLSS